MSNRQKITTFLWFNDNAEEAINLYCSVFKDSRIIQESRYSEAGPGPAGALMTATFELEGQQFMALNGGPEFKFNEAISLMVDCDSQEEVDTLWDKLTADGGEPSRCGWLKDKFGLSWQIIPSRLGELMADPDPARARAVAESMFTMSKIDIAELERAHAAA